MKTVYDQLHTPVHLKHPPKRIVSLVPSQTELLYDLGLTDEVVGITKFCIHPKVWFRSKSRVGGTKNADPEKVRNLEPDIIIGNKEENDRENIQEMSGIAPVWMSDIYTLSDALDMIGSIGAITGREQEATRFIEKIQGEFSELRSVAKHGKSCLYFMWKDPYLTVGKETFIDAMLEACGFENLQKSTRYPEWDFTSEQQPDVILLSSEPYPFSGDHFGFFQKRFPSAQILLVDGEYFSWYGSRLMAAPGYFKTVIEAINA